LEKLSKDSKKCQGTTSQALEKLSKDSKKCQGTTLVVPKEPQNSGGL
jgi:hypothetical protein